ncbi:MAG: DUF4058 family protein [bacterium]|nr:DUF4058 family protein [bacterium]
MPRRVQSIRNQYRGINAHAHSLWQAEGGWDEFHASHIIYLANALKAALEPLGYTASVQQSVQIRRTGQWIGSPESDVSIYDTRPSRQWHEPPQSIPGNPLVLAVPELLQLREPDVEQYRAVGVYRLTSTRRDRGEPIVWIEVLSPSNKPGGQDAAYYADKSLKLMQSGVVFVELDYLHESPPTYPTIANYRRRKSVQEDSDAHPYRILVVDPRPDLVSGRAQLYQVDVDDPLPMVRLPLNAGDVLDFDFGQPYTRTFEESRFGHEVNYVQLPLNFDRYSEADQTRIIRRMVAVLAAQEAGHDLESGPFPVEDISLEEGLRRLGVMGEASDP